jgi:hypothetical protein
MGTFLMWFQGDTFNVVQQAKELLTWAGVQAVLRTHNVDDRQCID